MKTMLDAFDEKWNEMLPYMERELTELPLEFGLIEIDIPMNISIGDGFSIIDIETTGIDQNRNKIVTLGIIHHNYLIVIQRALFDKDEFNFQLKKFFDDLCDNGVHRAFAYNCSFEKRFLSVVGAIDIEKFDFFEIMPYRVSKDNCVSFDHFGFGVGKDVPRLWKKWEKSKDLNCLHDIMRHNVNCLLKEFAIFSVNYSNYYEGCDD